MNIAHRTPFSGKPIITMPAVFGATPGKPFFTAVFAIGERPINFTVSGLPEGLVFDGEMISGKCKEGEYTITVTAENARGTDTKEIRLLFGKRMLRRTPLMGFTSWNAFSPAVTQDGMISTAETMTAMGISDYGYRYINLDSSWQDEYGGEFDAIQPTYDRFPDIAGMVEKIHSLGFYAGIYSTPFVYAWGCPKGRENIPGCTLLPADERFGEGYYFPIGKIRKEQNNVRQWTKWGFDYLKYDWKETDKFNADIMRKTLDESTRDFVYCLSVYARLEEADYLMENVNSWRSNDDTNGAWEREKAVFGTYFDWEKYTGYGHWFDLDMLSIGDGLFPCMFTDDEKLFQYSARALLCSPIQLSCTFEKATEFELDLYCNEEIIAVNQDALLAPAKTVLSNDGLYIFEKPLDGGDRAIGIFNTDDKTRTVEYPLHEKAVLRDLWMKEDVGVTNAVKAEIEPHSARIYRIRKA